MLKAAVLCFLLPALVISHPEFGFPCLDPFTGTIRSHREVWARLDMPCSGIICNNGIAQPSVCEVPDMLRNPHCTLDTRKSHMPYPHCCPTLNCGPLF